MDLLEVVNNVAGLIPGRPRPSRPREMALLCVLLGGVAALASLFFLPDLLIRDRAAQLAWLLAAPLATGLAAGVAGGSRSPNSAFSAFHFACGALFMLALSLARLAFCG